MPRDSAGHPSIRESLTKTILRAFHEFLTLPTAVIAAFFLLAAGSFALDSHSSHVHDPIQAWLGAHLFGHADTTANILGIVASGLITVTSIIISLLLVAIQQSASAMSMAVFDQFLRRRQNQFYFGFFVGLALFSMLTLATTHDRFNPIYGGTFAIVMGAVALYLLIILLYTTINQMRPAVVIDAIRRHALTARTRQRTSVEGTRRFATGQPGRAVVSANNGYITRIDFPGLLRTLRTHAHTTVVFPLGIGSFVAKGDTVAEIRGDANGDEIEHAVLASIRLERQRDLTLDAAYAVFQIENIAWTSISSAKSNPEPGLAGIAAIRILLAEWSPEIDKEEAARDHLASPVVYYGEPYEALFDALRPAA